MDKPINRWPPRQRFESGWLPIETAPRDGSSVLLWWPDYRYGSSEREGTPEIAIGWFKTGRNGIAYFADTDEGDDYGLIDHRPTHWMPLPEPPH